MGLKMKNGKIVSVSIPKLTKNEIKILESSPVNKKLIERATSRKYNVI